MAQILLWPLRSAAAVPALGITCGLAAGYYGAYDLTYNIAHTVSPIKVPVSDFSNYLGLGSGIGTSGVVWYLREKLFRPLVPPAPVAPLNASLSERMSTALAAARHGVVHYPYAFRLTSIVLCGMAGGVSHLHAQRAWAHRGDWQTTEEMTADPAKPATTD